LSFEKPGIDRTFPVFVHKRIDWIRAKAPVDTVFFV
jgi:hypothetical protein